jgi:hypothetical protein
LGVIAHQLRRPDAASLVGRAVTLNPDFAGRTTTEALFSQPTDCLRMQCPALKGRWR